MPKKKEKAPEGAPEWMVTYGDMMTLLLCFFVMIVAMSEIKKDERFMKVVESFKRQFGYNNGIGTTMSMQPPDVSQLVRRNATAAENKDLDKGESTENSQIGDYDQVRQIREGDRFVEGVVAEFEEGTAKMLPAGYDALRIIANKLRGLEFKIEVRGHTSAAPLPAGSPFSNHMELSMARAMVVRNWLIGKSENQGRIDPERIRVMGAGKYEPLEERVYVRSKWVKNDRVDVIQIEALAQDFKGQGRQATHAGF